MSTKNLGRTAVERGRIQRYRDEKSQINRSQRMRERLDVEDVPGRRRLRRSSYQTDNLSAVWSYLESFEGKPWNKVYSELRRRFDARTLLGRHVLFDHLIGVVIMPNDPNWDPVGTGWWNRYYVDDAGIFRVKRPEKKKGRLSEAHLTKIEAWLGGRGVALVDAKLHWVVPECKVGLMTNRYGYVYYTDKVMPNSKNYSYAGYGWANDLVLCRWDLNRTLSHEEVAFYQSLPSEVKDVVTIGEKYYVRGRDADDPHAEDRAQARLRLGTF